jgi:hypothetical protein
VDWVTNVGALQGRLEWGGGAALGGQGQHSYRDFRCVCRKFIWNVC